MDEKELEMGRAQEFEKGQRQIDAYLSRISGEVFDEADYLYCLINNYPSEMQPKLLKHLCEVFDVTDSNKSDIAAKSKYADMENELEKQYGDIVNSLIKAYISIAHSEDHFYELIWQAIKSGIFDEEAKQIFALYYIIIDRRIPYFRIDDNDSYMMSDERFSDLRRETSRERQRIRFLLANEFSQKTEQASQLLSVFGIHPPKTSSPEEIESYERQLMRMVYIYVELKRNEQQLLSMISRV